MQRGGDTASRIRKKPILILSELQEYYAFYSSYCMMWNKGYYFQSDTNKIM